MKPRIAALVGVIGLLGLVSAAQAAGPTPGIAQGGDGITIAGGARLVAIAGELRGARSSCA